MIMKTHLPLTLIQSLTVVNCMCVAVLIITFHDISYSAKLDSLENDYRGFHIIGLTKFQELNFFHYIGSTVRSTVLMT